MEKTKVACVKHHDIRMPLRRVLRDCPLRWPKHAFPCVRDTGIIENRPRLRAPR